MTTLCPQPVATSVAASAGGWQLQDSVGTFCMRKLKEGCNDRAVAENVGWVADCSPRSLFDSSAEVNQLSPFASSVLDQESWEQEAVNMSAALAALTPICGHVTNFGTQELGFVLVDLSAKLGGKWQGKCKFSSAILCVPFSLPF